MNLQAQIADILKHVEAGWSWQAKSEAMAELILSTDARLVVELGVFGGRSLLPQALAMREAGSGGLVVGIDPWRREAAIEGETGGENEAWWSNVDLHKIHETFINHLWNYGLETHCVVIRNKSDEAARLFAPGSIDILHIDSNHSEMVSCREVQTWLPLLKPEGYLWMDDLDWASTRKAQVLLLQTCNLIRTLDGKCGLFQLKCG